jgi:hypothetical protein
MLDPAQMVLIDEARSIPSDAPDLAANFHSSIQIDSEVQNFLFNS